MLATKRCVTGPGPQLVGSSQAVRERSGGRGRQGDKGSTLALDEIS